VTAFLFLVALDAFHVYFLPYRMHVPGIAGGLGFGVANDLFVACAGFFIHLVSSQGQIMTTQDNAQQMTAIVCHAPKDYRVETVTKPHARAHELVIRIAACGICASDCKCYSGAKMFWGGPSPWVKAPVIPGHEFFGFVDELGEGAAEHFGVKVGDRVIAEQIVPCGKCRYCKSGHYWMCEVHNIFGFQREVADGGMAEYMRFPPTAIVHKIPDGISLEDAAIIEPLACSIHTVNRGDVQLTTSS
jgi:threonine dehydrogenase-like Zn-dependent dehydrogenase